MYRKSVYRIHQGYKSVDWRSLGLGLLRVRRGTWFRKTGSWNPNYSLSLFIKGDVQFWAPLCFCGVQVCNSAVCSKKNPFNPQKRPEQVIHLDIHFYLPTLPIKQSESRFWKKNERKSKSVARHDYHFDQFQQSREADSGVIYWNQACAIWGLSVILLRLNGATAHN